MLCGICKQRETTGTLVHMCDECFAEFERKGNEAVAKGQKYNPTDQEIACIDGCLRYKDDIIPGGMHEKGTIKGVNIKLIGDEVAIETIPFSEEEKASMN